MGAFYTRSNFTLKTFAGFGYAFSIIMGGFYVRSKVTPVSVVLQYYMAQFYTTSASVVVTGIKY